MRSVKYCTYFVIVLLGISIGQTVDRNYLCNELTWGTYVSYPWENTEKMTNTINLDNLLKRSSQIVHWYGNWDDGTGDFVSKNNQQKWLSWSQNFTSMGNSNHIPMVSWQPWASPYSPTNNVYPMAEVAKGTFDSYIKNQAAGMKSYGKLMYLRPAHEFDGDWYPWGPQNTSPADFIAAWKRIKGIFNTAGASNVKFVWCPNNSNNHKVDQTDYFPGDEFIDFACIDAYSSTPTISFADTIGRYCDPPYPYQRITAVTSKPIIIAEFGVKPGTGSRADWYRQMAIDLPTKLPQIKAIVQFNKYDYSLTGDTATASAIADIFGNCANVPKTSSVIVNPQPVPTSSTSQPKTSTSQPKTSTSTSQPKTSTSQPKTSTSAVKTSTSQPKTSTSTSQPKTSTSQPKTSTSAVKTSSKSLPSTSKAATSTSAVKSSSITQKATESTGISTAKSSETYIAVSTAATSGYISDVSIGQNPLIDSSAIASSISLIQWLVLAVICAMMV